MPLPLDYFTARSYILLASKPPSKPNTAPDKTWPVLIFSLEESSFEYEVDVNRTSFEKGVLDRTLHCFVPISTSQVYVHVLT